MCKTLKSNEADVVVEWFQSRVGSLFLSAPAQGTSEPELGGGGGTSYNVLYEEKNIHINKKKKQ